MLRQIFYSYGVILYQIEWVLLSEIRLRVLRNVFSLPLFVISSLVEDMSGSISTPNKLEYLALVFRMFVSSSLVNNKGFMRYKFLSLMACVSAKHKQKLRKTKFLDHTNTF